MERQWELAKRKHSMDDHQNLHLRRHGGMIEKMWEEQAFAEDTLGAVGGSVWPPRSYSCSFCRREFRSAQALGGHMNVHRRDRARLKQSIPSDFPPGITYHHNSSVKSIPLHTNHMRTSTSLPATTNSSTKPDIQQFPLPVTPIIFNPNPIFTRGDPNPNLLTTPPYSHNKTFHRGDVQTFPHDSNTSSSLMLQEKSTKYLNDNSLNPSTQIYSRSKLGGSTNRYYSITNHIQKHPLSDESTTVESGGSCMVKRSYENAKTDLSVSLNLVLCRSCPRTLSGSYNDGKGDDRDLVMMSSCKRIKISGDADAHQTVSPCPVEELDLELRIGVGPHEVKY